MLSFFVYVNVYVNESLSCCYINGFQVNHLPQNKHRHTEEPFILFAYADATSHLDPVDVNTAMCDDVTPPSILSDHM